MKLKYVGGSSIRTISPEEFKGAGVSGAKAIETTHNGVVDVTAKVGKYLLEAEAGSWEETSDAVDDDDDDDDDDVNKEIVTDESGFPR